MSPDIASVQFAGTVPTSSSANYNIDPVCSRIRIYHTTYTLSGEEGRDYSTPKWTTTQVDRLTAISPTLNQHINELRALPNKEPWVIVFEPTDGCDGSTALKVLDMLASQTASKTELEDIAPVVSERTNALWFFEVIPSKYLQSNSWKVRDASYNILGSSSHPSAASNGTTNASVGWCWSGPSSYYPQETNLHLSNCALILGWEELFKREITPVIWDWSEPHDVFQTPVKRLKEGGLDGLKSRRKQEKKEILEHMHQYLDRKSYKDGANVRQTIKELQEHQMELHEPDKFEQTSIYSMMRDIEGAILRRRRSSGLNATHHSNGHTHAHGTSHHNHQHHHHQPNRTSGGSWSKRFKALESKIESKFSGTEEHVKFVRAMLDDTDKFIAGRQLEVATEMLTWRDEEIAAREKRLR